MQWAGPVGAAKPYDNEFAGIADGDTAWSYAHSNFLSSLSPEEKLELVRRSRTIELKPRDGVFQTGDEASYAYIVAEGCVRLFQVSPTGKETILWLSFPGEIFGMAELWNGDHRRICAIANQDTRIYRIRRQSFIRFLGDYPEAAMKAISILSARVRAMGCVMAGLSADNVETRIARLFVRFAVLLANSPCHSGVHDRECCVHVRLRHQDIANLIGASRQTVTSTLLDLRKQGIVRVVDHHFHIIRPEHFRALIETNAA